MPSSDSSSRDTQTTPDPDDTQKPQAPTQIDKPSWKYISRRTFREFSNDYCTDLAAALTFFGVLSLFPALLALMSLLGIIGQAEQTTQLLLQIIERIASSDVVDTLRPPIQQLANSPAAGFTFVIGLAGAIWSASGYVGAFGRAMNRIYEIEEGRPFYKLRPIMLAVTIALLLVAMVMAVLLVVSGPLAQAIGDVVGLGETALVVWNVAKWPILLGLAILLIAVLYYATPNVRQPKFRWISLGAVIAIVVLALATLGFFFYVSNFGNYNRTYGTIGGMIVLLLWIWIANIALLFGAEFDAEMERGRQLQGGIEAEENLQLPPRDTKASDKKSDKEQQDIEEGRKLREEYDQNS